MTHDLLERLRKTGHTDYALMDEAADKLEAYMAENAAIRAEKDEIRKALEPFALAVERAEKAAVAFGLSHRVEVPDSQDFGPLVVKWGDLRRAAAIRNMGERT